MQVSAMIGTARDILFGHSEICGVNFLNVLLAKQHLFSSFFPPSLGQIF